MNNVYLLFGSNLGNSTNTINTAVKSVADKIGAIVHSSSFYETAAWGNEEQPVFLNQVISINTMLDPLSLLKAILEIEVSLGRKRDGKKWQQRSIDIDILFYNDNIIHEPTLVIPHPYLHLRRFTLVPLAEIAPDLLHPIFKMNITRLLLNCTDKLKVIKK